jgi:hypothetical protein
LLFAAIVENICCNVYFLYDASSSSNLPHSLPLTYSGTRNQNDK